jgi:hypothetical protein
LLSHRYIKWESIPNTEYAKEVTDIKQELTLKNKPAQKFINTQFIMIGLLLGISIAVIYFTFGNKRT